MASLFAVAALAVPARAETAMSLGSLERTAVGDALAQLGLTVDPNPVGKIVDRIYVVNQDVFPPNGWLSRIFNVFHRTTRPETVLHQLLLLPGQSWDPSLADETVRNLQTRPPLFFANGTLFGAPQVVGVAALVPVSSSSPTTVDVLVVTRDLWSLRFNTEFDFQRNSLSSLRTSISENNLFGWHKQLAAELQLDPSRFGVGPTYYDPNLAGTRLTFLAQATAWYSRDDEGLEGHSALLSLRYPLYSLARRWGAGLDVSHGDTMVRSFCEHALCTADVGETSVPLAYRLRSVAVDLNAVRAFGESMVQRLTAGYRVSRQRPFVPENFPADPSRATMAKDFLAQWAPLPETRSEAYLRYEMFMARYGVFRDLDTFDLRENRRLGPLFSIETAAGLPTLGADFVAYPMAATASWAGASETQWFALAQVQASARLRSSSVMDQRLSELFYLASPSLAGAGRVILMATTEAVRADTCRTRFFLGGDTGLRGYQTGELQGTVKAIAHAELRTSALAVGAQRLGLVLFYDVGDAAPSYEALLPHHDFGIGIRWLIPQLNASVLRIDWAVAAQETLSTQPAFPGRITAGFMQSFWLLDSPRGYLPM